MEKKNQGKLWYQTQVVEIFYDNVTYLSILNWKNAFYYCKEHWPLMQLWQIEKPEITIWLDKCDKGWLFYEGRKNLQNDAFQQKSGNSHF